MVPWVSDASGGVDAFVSYFEWTLSMVNNTGEEEEKARLVLGFINTVTYRKELFLYSY